jgi:hypothetical protein
MGRADIPEDQRVDFALYVDEFQNFATDSFENILSEARKYRLNLILANQFVSQLTDKIREAIIGNVGTVISGRIGTTDAELMAKKFMPVFDAEDLTKLPNYEGVAVAQINGVPSAPFSMIFPPILGHPNPRLAEALKKLSAAKYGKPRADVEREIFARLRAGDMAKEAKKKAFEQRMNAGQAGAGGGSSFLDEWLAKRKQLQQQPPAPKPAAPKPAGLAQPTIVTVPSGVKPAVPPPATAKPAAAPKVVQLPPAMPAAPVPKPAEPVAQPKPADDIFDGDEIFIDLRGNLHHKSDLDEQAEIKE